MVWEADWWFTQGKHTARLEGNTSTTPIKDRVHITHGGRKRPHYVKYYTTESNYKVMDVNGSDNYRINFHRGREKDTRGENQCVR